MPPEATKKQPSQEDLEFAFRESLHEAALIIEVLQAFCGSFEEAVGMIRFGCQSDAQLRMLMAAVHQKMATIPVKR